MTRVLVALLALTGLLLMASACTSSPPATVVIPIYNSRGLEAVRTTLSQYIQPGDVFLVISGNVRGSIKVSQLNSFAATLKAEFPDTEVIAGTSGLDNLSRAAAGVTHPIKAIAYIYEPNFRNEPEFAWDFQTTLAIFEEVTQIARASGLRSVGKPTGRPILEGELQEHRWDYRALAQRVDEIVIQTQTYCKKGVDTFETAVEKVLGQYEQTEMTPHWIPEVTVDPDGPNGVSPPQAFECSKVAKSKGLTSILMWWSPAHPMEAVEFMELLGR